ncbi:MULTISPECIES: hypothetical protein [unclassified Streptosporangium]|uniref:hypothetical protein n=1 Tax=unclassified Streptosporangium TaxID=2632669 RepID=UPI002E2A1F77|nr:MULTISPECIES: hypothetical protein [unclassified Streptosporangium]
MVDQPQSDVRVDLGLPDRVGIRENSHHVSKPVRDLRQLITPHPPLRQYVRAAEALLGRGLADKLFLDPSGDERRVGARLKGSPMLGELAVALGDLAACHSECLGLGRCHVLCGRQDVESLINVVGREQPAEPAVQSRDDAVLS